MTVPWPGLAVIAVGALVCLGLIFGMDKRDADRRSSASPPADPMGIYRRFVQEKKRSPSRYDRFQARLIPWVLRLDPEPAEISPEAERFLMRLLGACGLCLCLLLAGIYLLTSWSWGSPAIIAAAEADFEAVKADDSPGRFDAELNQLFTRLRDQRGYEIRALRFKPHRIDPVCEPTSGTPRAGQCRVDRPDRPLHTWSGEAVWQERRHGQGAWRDRSCTLTVSWTLARAWQFLGYRGCQSIA